MFMKTLTKFLLTIGGGALMSLGLLAALGVPTAPALQPGNHAPVVK